MSALDTLKPGGPIHWGVMLAQGWKGELARTGWDDSWPIAGEWARKAETLGFDGIWAFDHFQPYPARDDSPVLEAWTALAALSQVTKHAVLGTLVSCAAHRPPEVTARMARNLQVLTGGRFCLGLGAGWDRSEFDALKIPSDQQQADPLSLRPCFRPAAPLVPGMRPRRPGPACHCYWSAATARSAHCRPPWPTPMS